jgi:acyl-CoA synthetase (AMP-forming)/AMP-acid ligase II
MFRNSRCVFCFASFSDFHRYRNNHVSPTEIEGILQKHSGVQEGLVFGKKSAEVQELISAVVVRKEGSNVI